jgi:hypothetical protein
MRGATTKELPEGPFRNVKWLIFIPLTSELDVS